MQKMMPPLPEKDGNDAAAPDGACNAAPRNKSLFKPRPGDDDFDPLDLANDPQDFEQEELHPSALADQERADVAYNWRWSHPDGLSIEDVDRQDRALASVAFGKPRTVFLSTGPYTIMRLTPTLGNEPSEGFGGSDPEGFKEKFGLKLDAAKPVKLAGPATPHAIDEVTSALYARAPAFGTFLQAMRESAHLALARGANFFRFGPMLVVSPPGLGKTTLTHLLAEETGLPLIYLDGATMMTTVSLTGGDAVFRTSRPSQILTGIIQHEIGNPIVVFDEVDKLADVSHGARAHPAEALLPFLERRTAGQVREHFVQIDLDLSHLNWVLLANDLASVPKTVRDRCKVIQIPPLTPKDLAVIAQAEIALRHLEPELVPALSRACARGQITSLRKLHKTLDAATATLGRPRLH